LDEIERLFIIRIKDRDARAIVRGRLANMAAVAVTPNVWELPKTAAEPDDPDADAAWWDEELRRLEDAIDPRTDAIYMWVCTSGSMVRWAIGQGGE